MWSSWQVVNFRKAKYSTASRTLSSELEWGWLSASPVQEHPQSTACFTQRHDQSRRCIHRNLPFTLWLPTGTGLVLLFSLAQHLLHWKQLLIIKSSRIPSLNYIPWCPIHISLHYLDGWGHEAAWAQCLATLSMKRLLLVSNLNLPCCNSA